MNPISNEARKTPVILSILSFFVIASTAYAQAKGFIPLAPVPGLTKGAAADTTGLANFFNNLYKYLIGLAATLAVIQIVWAGFEIAFNREDVSKITDSKGKIYNALLGLVLVLSPVLVFTIINPSILNLSLNLPPLETKFAAPATTNPNSAAGMVQGTTVYSTPSAGNATAGSWCYSRTYTSGLSTPGDGSVCTADEASCNKNRMLDARPADGGTGNFDIVSLCGQTPVTSTNTPKKP